MGAIVIRTRFDEGTESTEVATSGPTPLSNIPEKILKTTIYRLSLL
jgi:hypothetical protein